MTSRRLALLVIVCAVIGVAEARERVKDEDTIKSLEEKTVEVKPGKLILDSSELARQSYRDFLDLVSEDPELRAEAMRRLGDLELESTEAQQLAENIDALDTRGFDNAVELYQKLLEAYPDYRRNDTVLYQLARAYEVGGRTDEALDVLNELIARYPNTGMKDEVQFRSGIRWGIWAKSNGCFMVAGGWVSSENTWNAYSAACVSIQLKFYSLPSCLSALSSPL